VGADDGFNHWDRYPEGQYIDGLANEFEFFAILCVLAFGVLLGAGIVGLVWWLT
jgi:hypothetical protein